MKPRRTSEERELGMRTTVIEKIEHFRLLVVRLDGDSCLPHTNEFACYSWQQVNRPSVLHRLPPCTCNEEMPVVPTATTSDNRKPQIGSWNLLLCSLESGCMQVSIKPARTTTTRVARVVLYCALMSARATEVETP